jgi:gliding motility-associated-like protein
MGLYPLSPIKPTEVQVNNITCDHAGSLKFIQPRSGFLITWTDSKGNIVGYGNEIDNLQQGYYVVTLSENGGCPSSTASYYITDQRVQMQLENATTQCAGDSTVTYYPNIRTPNGVVITNYYWINAKGDTISTNNGATLPLGNYTLAIKDNNNCSYSGTFSVSRGTFPTLDGSKAIVTDADCGQNNGSITNVIIKNISAGSYAGWFDSYGNFKSYGPDLTNVAPGTYYYSITYNYSCATLVTPNYTVRTKNGIIMDESNAKPTPSSCGIASGSVTGIVVTNATQYQWRDASGNVISTKLNLTGVPAGTYTLTASNSTGCDVSSQPYTIQTLPPTVYPAYPYTSNNTCPNSATGSISITTDNLVAGYRWVDSQGNNKGIGPTVTGLTAGNYSLYLTDKNGCESFYNTYTITNITPVSILSGSGQVTNDQCNLKQGGITGIQVSAGIQPYTYAWTDNNGNSVSTSLDLSGVGAGNYTLTVTDASGCTPATQLFTIQNTDSTIPPPSVSNVQVCSSGSALINVNNASSTVIYNLYTDAGSTTPAEQSLGGKFKVDVSSNTSFYITQTSGTCESGRAKVDISVGLSALNIPNTFTPNGDGINDYWQINNIENYPNSLVQVFTRDGQKIFESKGYAVPFDGTYKGKKLPSGVYYFIINLNANCSLLSGSLTLLR